MKRRLLLLAWVGALLLNAVPVQAQDGFYVIGGHYTPGTKITSLPYTITAPGYYYLTGNLSYAGGNGIMVNEDNVTIDLMGFVLSGPSNGSNDFMGITITGNNVEIRNGTITGWAHGIFQMAGFGARAIGVRAVGNTEGINLMNIALIEGCTATQGSFANGFAGLRVFSGTISGCTVYNFTNSSQPNSGSLSIDRGTASDNVVVNCSAIGIWGASERTTISHNAVLNCSTGISNKGGGSIVGNAVLANAGQTGIAPATGALPIPPNPPYPSLLDQNSVKGNTPYGPGNSATVWGLNSP